MLNAIFPDLKMVRCYRCDCQIFMCSPPHIQKVTYIEDGEAVTDEIEVCSYSCKECGLTFSE